MKPEITLPILKDYSSDYYLRIILDSSNKTHYWNFDGTYDGYSYDYIDQIVKNMKILGKGDVLVLFDMYLN